MLRLCGVLKVKLRSPTSTPIQGLGTADLPFGGGEDIMLQDMAPAFSSLYSVLARAEVGWTRLELARHDESGQEKKRSVSRCLYSS